MSTFANGDQETYAHINAAMHPPSLRPYCHYCDNQRVVADPGYDGHFLRALAPQIPCPACVPVFEDTCPACSDSGEIGDLLGGTVACSECRPLVRAGLL